MTNEELIKGLDSISCCDCKHWNPMYGGCYENRKCYEYIVEAIEALEKQEADGCVGCAFEDVEEWEKPCVICKRNNKDYWRAKA